MSTPALVVTTVGIDDLSKIAPAVRALMLQGYKTVFTRYGDPSDNPQLSEDVHRLGLSSPSNLYMTSRLSIASQLKKLDLHAHVLVSSDTKPRAKRHKVVSNSRVVCRKCGCVISENTVRRLRETEHTVVSEDLCRVCG